MLYSFVTTRENHTRVTADKNTERWVRKSISESNRSEAAQPPSFELERGLTCRWSRSQAASENLRIFRGNFARAQVAVGVIPGTYPVDCPGDSKRDQLGIARPDGAVGDPLLNIAAKSRIQAT